jgi:putative addiction module killer protein
MTQAKLVFIFINHKLTINHAIECIVLNWQDYRIIHRIRAAEAGNFSNCEPMGEGVSEMRIHVRPGYRFIIRSA